MIGSAPQPSAFDEVPRLPTGMSARRWTVRGAPDASGRRVHLAVAAIGRRAAPAVVLAHGVGSSARFVAAACAAPLREAGFRLVTFDARGHGGSTPQPDPRDHHLDAHAADLAAVVASAGPVAAVGGVSLGGHAALRWAGDLPRVVCLPAWLGRATAGRGPHALVAAEVRGAGIAAVIERLRADATMPGWLRRTLVTDYARHDAASLAAALVALDGASAPDEAEVAALTAPVAVVGWRDDPGHPFEVATRVASAARRGRLVELALGDLDAGLTRLGAAVVQGLRAAGVG